MSVLERGGERRPRLDFNAKSGLGRSRKRRRVFIFDEDGNPAGSRRVRVCH
jgi:hypothetical protein